ncbi:MAG: PASTA domain-containing protein [Saprospirales bacterium]|nr:PASTA domain-containing protein [Saprospirales bacterium]MBK8490790.1 PASTA domain-containing protein [Saprospirales bacterium]
MTERLIQWWNEQVLPRLKTYWLELRLFLTSLFFWKSFSAMVGAALLLTSLIFFWMKCYTNHGQSVQVQDYTNMTVKEATAKARNRSFRVEVIDSIWRDGIEPNIVLEQTPNPFSRVKEKRTIYLTVSKNTAEEVTLPTLVGNYDYFQYQKKLANKGVYTSIRERIFDNKQAENTILYFFYKDEKITETSLKSGVRIPKGSTLEFVITERGGELVEVPDFTCKQLTAAEFLIATLDLNIGNIKSDVTVTDQTSAYVYNQKPEPGQTIRVGEQVDLYITQDPPLGCPEEGQ